MKILSFSYENFRNLADDTVTPHDGVNVIYGENAQGKTNLLEGIWLFTGGHSFRGARDNELIKFDRNTGKTAEFIRLSAEYYSAERKQTAVLKIAGGKRSSVINGVEKRTGSALVGKICAVIFSPEHLLLVKEGPARRRSFIDAAICQLKPSYTKAVAFFNRSLSQRNALLKDITRSPQLIETLDIWNNRMAEFACTILRERDKYIKSLIPHVNLTYGEISKNREEMQIKYVSTIKNMDLSMSDSDMKLCYLEQLKKLEISDIRAGFTTCGPHRDDLDIYINNLSARAFASQGQQRSAVLALKLSEANILSQAMGEPPVILLDDVMSELDLSRQDYLLNHLGGKQVFITCCMPETVNLMDVGKRLKIHEGRVIPENISGG